MVRARPVDSAARACRAGAILLAVVFAASPARADDATVRFASVGGMSDAGLYLADELGYFKAAGLAIDMERADSAPTLTTAIATNQIDVGGIAVSPGLFAAAAQGMGLRIVGDKMSIRPGFSAIAMMVRQDLWRGSVPATIRDLKGSKIAVSAKASSAYFMVLRFLAAHDLAPDDVEIVELAYPNMLPALKNGAVDVVHSLEPFGALIRDAGLGAMVSDLTEVVPPQGFNLVALVYGEGFIARRATAQAFMTAYMRGVRVYNDAFGKGKDRDEVTEIIARHARLDPKLVADAAPAGLDPDQRIDRATLQTLQQFFLDQHYLSAPVDLARLVDSSFAEAAVAALGAYR